MLRLLLGFGNTKMNVCVCVCVCVCTRALSHVRLYDAMGCSLPESVHGILQARIPEWVAMPSSRGSSQPRDWTHVSYISSLTGGFFTTRTTWEAPGGSDGKESACNARDLGLIPGVGKSPGEGNGYWLQYSCLENSIDRGAWQVTYSPWGHKESDTTQRLTLSINV